MRKLNCPYFSYFKYSVNRSQEKNLSYVKLGYLAPDRGRPTVEGLLRRLTSASGTSRTRSEKATQVISPDSINWHTRATVSPRAVAAC
jgi:hypothetical protein